MAVKSPEFRLLIEKISFCRAYVYSGGEFVVRLCGTYDGCQESRRCLLRDWAEGCGRSGLWLVSLLSRRVDRSRCCAAVMVCKRWVAGFCK